MHEVAGAHRATPIKKLAAGAGAGTAGRGTRMGDNTPECSGDHQGKLQRALFSYGLYRQTHTHIYREGLLWNLQTHIFIWGHVWTIQIQKYGGFQSYTDHRVWKGFLLKKPSL